MLVSSCFLDGSIISSQRLDVNSLYQVDNMIFIYDSIMFYNCSVVELSAGLPVQRGRLLVPSWRAVVPSVGLAARRPPGGLLWALWAVLVPWCLPSSVQVVRGCVAVSAAVVVCCAAVDAVPPGRLLWAAADRWRVSWPVCRGPAMVQRGRGCLRAASAAMDRGGRGLLACVGSRSRSGFFPNCIARYRVAWRGIWHKFAPGGKSPVVRKHKKRAKTSRYILDKSKA